MNPPRRALIVSARRGETGLNSSVQPVRVKTVAPVVRRVLRWRRVARSPAGGGHRLGYPRAAGHRRRSGPVAIASFVTYVRATGGARVLEFRARPPSPSPTPRPASSAFPAIRAGRRSRAGHAPRRPGLPRSRGTRRAGRGLSASELTTNSLCHTAGPASRHTRLAAPGPARHRLGQRPQGPRAAQLRSPFRRRGRQGTVPPRCPCRPVGRLRHR